MRGGVASRCVVCGVNSAFAYASQTWCRRTDNPASQSHHSVRQSTRCCRSDPANPAGPSIPPPTTSTRPLAQLPRFPNHPTNSLRPRGVRRRGLPPKLGASSTRPPIDGPASASVPLHPSRAEQPRPRPERQPPRAPVETAFAQRLAAFPSNHSRAEGNTDTAWNAGAACGPSIAEKPWNSRGKSPPGHTG